MGWSRILDSDLGIAAKAEYERDPRRRFHGWDHVENLYWAAEHVYGFDYDLQLDRAILTHDVIYDEHPLKELRSGRWLLNHCMDDGVEIAFNHIMRTAKPKVEDDNRMILLDYARLRKRSLILTDRTTLAEETAAMTGASPAEFARSNVAYFTSVMPNFESSKTASRPLWERQAFEEIHTGMGFLIEYSNLLLDRAA
jgi:hypothetical protein